MNGHFDVCTLLLVFVSVNALACGLLLILQSLSTFQRRGLDVQSTEPPAGQPTSKSLFFSIHIPIHNEPAAVVIDTLEHLARLDATTFEVIVLDNNTKEPAIWLPVQEACERFGSKFRFYHRDNVIGAKAGALNIAASLADRRATHFVILDADYQVTPDFITIAEAAIVASGADFIQFPQAYRDQARAPSVATELADYFLNVAPHTNRARAMLLTGTLSVIDRNAIAAVGGWSGATITEDAELGVRLHLAQHRGMYVHRTVGRGMLPLDFDGLVTQRDRWVAGNVQTLITAVKAGLLPITPSALAIWAQLTAWVNLFAFPAFILILLALFPSNSDMSVATSTLAGATILAAMLVTAIRLAFSAGQQPFSVGAWLGVCRVKLALMWSAALAWFPVILGTKLRFKRTLKANADTARSLHAGLAMISIVFAGVSIVYFIEGQFVAAFASIMLAQCWFAARSVDQELMSQNDFRQGGNPLCSV